MALPDQLRPSYHDPQLWLRLGPHVREKYENQAHDLASGPLKNEADYRYARGYVDALRWVIEESREITKIEEQGDDE